MASLKNVILTVFHKAEGMVKKARVPLESYIGGFEGRKGKGETL